MQGVCRPLACQGFTCWCKVKAHQGGSWSKVKAHQLEVGNWHKVKAHQGGNWCVTGTANAVVTASEKGRAIPEGRLKMTAG